MKKFIFFSLCSCLLLTGCHDNDKKSVIREFNKKFHNSNGYHLVGTLEVHNNDDVFNYDVNVYYKKNQYYKVILVNSASQHTQIIVKNADGVFVLTPAFNKSFKFQSDWPYDNSQIYLLDALVKDIEKDKNIHYLKNDNGYVVQTKVYYPNNSKLINQKIFFNAKKQLKKVVVYDKNGIDSMTMVFKKIEYSQKLSKKDFRVDDVMNQKYSNKTSSTGSLDDIIYPLFVPGGTKLVKEENVAKDQGKRVLMNYDGEKSFLLVEETADVFYDFTIIPSFGEPFFLMDTMGVMTDNSLSWSSGGIDFYLVSDVMSIDEMVEIAQSIGTVSSMK